MIAVTFALPNESRDFVRLLARGNHEVVILHTGVGQKITRERIEPFLAQHRVDSLISSGFAGGTAPLLGVGDLLLAENFSDPVMLENARELLIAHVGKLATAESVIETEEARDKFASEQGALAVDMETAVIAQACAARKLPMLSLRVISDTAAAPFPAPASVLFSLARQKTEPLALAKHLARHPSAVVRLSRFARQISSARNSLTNALTVLVRELR
ncbi:MAG: hypothetical protein H0X40_07315 [Chthoniobacterales bacterium]|nr:hypothetical protein [Chthoniobacterales bacterium]